MNIKVAAFTVSEKSSNTMTQMLFEKSSMSRSTWRHNLIYAYWNLPHLLFGHFCFEGCGVVFFVFVQIEANIFRHFLRIESCLGFYKEHYAYNYMSILYSNKENKHSLHVGAL